MNNQNFAKKVLLFVSGGISAEHRIALLSAQNVYPYLDRKRFEVVPVYIAQNGGWWYLREAQAQNWPQLEFTHTAELEPVELLPSVRNNGVHGLGVGLGMRTPKQIPTQEIGIDLIFPMMHGPSGEDGTIQGLAQLFGVPIVGCDMSGSLINMDKVLMKMILKDKCYSVCPLS